MRKIFAFAAAALMLVSCVVSEQTNNHRTDYNLYRFTSDMISSSVEVTLRNLTPSPGVYAEESSFTGTVDPDIRPVITKVGDNAWTSVYKRLGLEFRMDVRRVGSESWTEDKWIFSGLDLKFDEGDGFSFTLVSEDDVTYVWESSGSQLRVDYNLVPTGAYKAQFYSGGEVVDWCNVSYVDGRAESASSRRW